MDEEARTAPRADCIADSAGGLTFDIAVPCEVLDGADAVASVDCSGANVLLCLRRSSGPDHEVRLPLTPSGDGRLRAALPSSVPLAEGRWDAFMQIAGREPERLAPGVNDLRSLVDRVPSGAHGHVSVRIPYVTKQGNLTVRSWRRPAHAETGELLIEAARLIVHGRVYGARLTGEAYAELCGRHDGAPVLRVIADAGRAPEFRCVVPYERLVKAAAPGIWDLWLRPGGEQGPRVRMGRLLDDVADKKAIFTYPTVRLGGEHGPVDAAPYYTLDNDLSIRVGGAQN